MPYAFNPFTGKLDVIPAPTTITLTGDATGSGTTTISTSINTFSGSAKGLVPTSPGGTTNFLRADGSWAPAGGSAQEDIIGFVVDGAGSAITTGSKGYREIPYACTINSWTILGKESGSCVVDVKRCTYAGFPTTSSIAGSEKPTLSSAQKNQDTSLSTWTTSLSAGDILEFVVDSASTVTRITVSLKVTRS